MKIPLRRGGGRCWASDGASRMRVVTGWSVDSRTVQAGRFVFRAARAES